LIPPSLRGTNWEVTIPMDAGAIILMAPAIMIVRQVQGHRSAGTAFQLSGLSSRTCTPRWMTSPRPCT
jgi:hypothetical protein